MCPLLINYSISFNLMLIMKFIPPLILNIEYYAISLFTTSNPCLEFGSTSGVLQVV